MKIIEIGTGYTSIPASMGAATEIVVEEISKSLSKSNVNYEIFDIEDENREKTNLKIREIKVPKVFRKKDTTLGLVHKFKRVVYSLSLAKELRKEIKNSEEKLCLHFHNQYNMFFFCKTTPKKLKEKVKIFYTVHSYIWNNKWEDIESTIKKKYFQEVYCAKNADKVFILNKITKEHFIKHYNISENRIVQIDNGVNIDIYKPRKNNEKNFIFFQSGSVCDRKNQLCAIKNLTKLLQENKNCKYMYAGGIIEKDYKDKIDEYVSKNNICDSVKYLGEVKPGKELSKYYNQAKAFVFPSKAESFGIVILEAMASGIPVIMNRKAILEILNDLEDVILFYNDQKEFDDIIKNKILNEKERQKYAKLSRKIVEEKYSWDAITKRFLEEFEK